MATRVQGGVGGPVQSPHRLRARPGLRPGVGRSASDWFPSVAKSSDAFGLQQLVVADVVPVLSMSWMYSCPTVQLHYQTELPLADVSVATTSGNPFCLDFVFHGETMRDLDVAAIVALEHRLHSGPHLGENFDQQLSSPQLLARPAGLASRSAVVKRR